MPTGNATGVSEIDRRRESTLANSQVVYQKDPLLRDADREMAELVQTLSPQELETPRLAMAFFGRRDKTIIIRVHWVSDCPMVTGVLLTNGSESLSLPLTDHLLEANEADAPQTLVFGAEFWIRHGDVNYEDVHRITSKDGTTVTPLTGENEWPVTKPLIKWVQSAE